MDSSDLKRMQGDRCARDDGYMEEMEPMFEGTREARGDDG